MTILDILKSIRDFFVQEEADIETFLVNAAKYAAANIKPELLKIVSDCMASAEEAALSAIKGDFDKAAFAFSNVVAACEKDGVEFILADFNYAREAVIQQRNASLDAQKQS